MINTNIDWLQFSGFTDFTNIHKKVNNVFKMEICEFSTRHFKTVAEITDLRQNKKIAVFAFNPHSAALDKNLILIKINNWLLYQNYLIQYIEDLLEYYDIKFNNLTRVDICRDFQKLDYRNQLPKKFIKNFLHEKYIKVRKSKGQVYFNNGENLDFQYLKFGSGKSRICCYLYNKTKELNEIENKPYIREQWVKAGLNENLLDVWRCEFRLQNFDFLLTDTETGEQISYNGNVCGLNSLDIINNCENLFNALSNHYLEFKKVNENRDTNKSRKTSFYLFNQDKKTLFNRVYNDNPESGRAEKIFIKKLYTLNNELRGTDHELSIYGETVLQKVIEAHELTKWALNKQFITP
jgi:hypothetical protein